MSKCLWGLAAALTAAVQAETVVVPGQAVNVGGNGAYHLPLSQAPASYMMVIGAPELNGRLPLGARISGVVWRRAGYIAHATWPQIQANFDTYDVYMATSTRSPGQLYTAFPMSNLGSDLKVVRSGPLSFPAGSFPGGATSPDANAWGTAIHFTSSFTYHGGDLVIMVRHTGNNAGNCMLDWLPSGFASVGGQAIGIQSYTQNSNWEPQGNAGLLATTLIYSTGCYPNCDGSVSSPVLNIYDMVCFLNKYLAGDPYANCDRSLQEPVLTVADFSCFLQSFSLGCD